MITDETPGFELPATLRGYLTEPAIRTGVDALLMVKSDSLPPDLRIDELGDYYAARAAAELTRYDWAAALYGLWTRIWAETLDNRWSQVSTETLMDDGHSVTPVACWDDEGFCVYHSKGSVTLSTGISFDSGTTQISFSVDNDQGPMLRRDLTPFKWCDEDDDDWPEWLVFNYPVSPLDPLFQFDELRNAASKAVHEANRLAG